LPTTQLAENTVGADGGPVTTRGALETTVVAFERRVTSMDRFPDRPGVILHMTLIAFTYIISSQGCPPNVILVCIIIASLPKE
jgi:hypothetical protein